MAGKKNSFNEQKIEELIEKGVKKLENMDCGKQKSFKSRCSSGATGCIWFLGFVGSAVYFIQQATSFGVGVVGLLKALVWPAFLVYHLFSFLKI